MRHFYTATKWHTGTRGLLWFTSCRLLRPTPGDTRPMPRFGTATHRVCAFPPTDTHSCGCAGGRTHGGRPSCRDPSGGLQAPLRHAQQRHTLRLQGRGPAAPGRSAVLGPRGQRGRPQDLSKVEGVFSTGQPRECSHACACRCMHVNA